MHYIYPPQISSKVILKHNSKLSLQNSSQASTKIREKREKKKCNPTFSLSFSFFSSWSLALPLRLSTQLAVVVVEKRLKLRKCLLDLMVGPQRVLLARATVPTGSTIGGGGRALEVDMAMVQGLVGHPLGLAGAVALVLVLVLGLAQALATGMVVGVLTVVGMGLAVVARVAMEIAHHRSPGTKRTMAEADYVLVWCCM